MTISTILTLWYGFGIFIGLLTVPWAIRREKEILRTVEQDDPQEPPKGFWAYYTTAEGQNIRQFFTTPQEYTMVVDREKRIASSRRDYVHPLGRNRDISDIPTPPNTGSNAIPPQLPPMYFQLYDRTSELVKVTTDNIGWCRTKWLEGKGDFVVIGVDNNALDVVKKPKPMPTEMTR